MMATEIASAYVSIWPSLNGVGAKIQSALGSVDTTSTGVSMGGKMATGIGSGLSSAKVAIGNVVANVATAGIGQITQSLSEAVSRIDTLNQFPVIMKQMGFSTDEANAAMTRLNEGVQGLPTSLDTVVASCQRLALETGDLDLAADAAIALNDAFLASGSSTYDAARGMEQFDQMLAAGKVDGQSWRTLTETMGPALTQVAESLGYTSAVMGGDFYTALQNGTISMDDVLQKFIELDQASGGFAETAGVASQTIETAWTNAHTALVRQLANIIDLFYDDIVKLGNNVASAIDFVGKGVVKGIAAIKDNVSQAGKVVSQAFTIMGSGASKLIKAIAGLEPVQKVMDMVKEAASHAGEGFETLKKAMATGVLNAARRISTEMSSVAAIISGTGTPVEKLKGIFNRFGGELSSFARDMKGNISDAFSSLSEKSGNLQDKMWDLAENGAKKLPGAFDSIAKYCDTIPNGFGKIASSLASLYGNFASLLPGAIEKTHSAFDKLSGSVSNTAVSAFDKLKNAISDLPDKISSAIDSLNVIPDTIKRIGDNDMSLIFDYPTIAKFTESVKNAASHFTVTGVAAAGLTAVFSNIHTVLGKLGQAFPSTSRAASALSGVLTRLSPVSDVLGKALSSVVSGFGKVTTTLSAGVLSTSIFSSAFDTLKDAVGRVGAGFTGVVPSIKSFAMEIPGVGTAMQAAERRSMTFFGYLTNEALGSLENLGGKFSGVSAKVGEFASGVSSKLTPVTSAFEGMGSRCSGALGKVGEAVSKVAGKGTVLESWGTKIAAVFGLTGGQAMGLVGKLMKITNPIGAIISSFASMVISDEDFRNSIMDLVASIGQSLWPALKTIGECFLNVAEAVIPVLLDVFDQLTPVLAEVGKLFLELVAAVAPLVSELISNLAPVITSIIEALMPLVEAVLPVVVSAINIIIDVIRMLIPVITEIIQVIVNVVSVVAEVIGTVITVIIDAATVVMSAVGTVLSGFEAALSVVSGVFQSIFSVISGVMNTISSVIMSAISAVLGFFRNMATGIASIVSSVFNTVSSIFNSIRNTVVNIVSGIVNKVTSFFQKIASTISGMAGKFTSAVKSAFDGAINFITSLPGKALQWGKDIIQGIIDGIGSMVGAVGDAVSNIASTITGFLGFSEPEEGPLSNFHTYMPDMIDLLCSGMYDGVSDVAAAAGSVAAAVNDQMSFETDASIKPYNYSVTTTQKTAVSEMADSVEDFTNAVYMLKDVLSTDNGSVNLYMDGTKVATTVAKPMNRALSVLAKREGI